MSLWNVAKSIIKQRIGQIPYPSFITYFPTMRCNLKCIFCDIWKNQQNFSDELTLSQIETTFSTFPRVDVLRLSGGEPFLRKDLFMVTDVICRQAKPDFVHITTNGVLTENIENYIQRVQCPEKIHIKISIDGLEARHDEIRGVAGTYKKAMATLNSLIVLQPKFKFYVGVNYTVAEEKDIEGYYKLRRLLSRNKITIYPVIASKSENALYSRKEMLDSSNSTDTFGNFRKEDLSSFINKLLRDAKLDKNLKESIVNRYHLKGLKNRLLYNIKKPHPQCVALTNHIRVLPNGDVPVCLYNGKIIGNLLRQPLQDLWFKNSSVLNQREWVKECKGCWQSCETIVSAIYTGDIYKGFF